jgi:hypothetical protein
MVSGAQCLTLSFIGDGSNIMVVRSLGFIEFDGLHLVIKKQIFLIFRGLPQIMG